MAKLVNFGGFCDGMYLEGSALFDASRAINLFPVPGGPNSKSSMALWGRPGLSQSGFALTLPNSPARALWAGNNRLFGAGGTHFYEFGSGGTVLTDYGAMASSSGLGPCQIVANGTQLMVMDASSALLYSATGGPGAGTMPIAQVVDNTGASVGNMGAVALEYLDGFYIAIGSAATAALVIGGGNPNPNLLMVSNYMDGTSWQAINYVIRTGSADLTTNLAVLNSQLWIFGQKNTEIWYNAGGALFPFARVPGATLNLGLAWPYTVVKFENCLMFPGADDRGYVKVYRTRGQQAEAVSTLPVDNYLAGWMPSIGALVTAYGYQENGHSFYVLTQHQQSTYLPLNSIVYDLTVNKWHERAYASAWPVCAASVPGFNSNGPLFVGDGTSGKVMFQGTGYANDLGTAISYTRTAPHLSNADKWAKYSQFQLDADLGTAQPVMSYSNDGGKHFSTPRAPLAASNEQGTAADAPTRPRFNWWQLGRSRDRVFRLQITDSSNLIRIVNAYVRAGAGTES